MKIQVRIIVFIALVSFFEMSAFTPTVKWSFDTKDASFGQSAAGDIDGDGKLEIVFGCYRNDSCIYALNSEDGSLLWKYNAHGDYEGCNDVAPAIFDIDADGIPEVIVPSSCNPKTYCFDGKSGKLRWITDTKGSDSPPSIADIDNDGKSEILHGEFGGYVICINAENGSIKWEIAVDTDSWIQTAPTILDVDNDGQLDFIVGTWNAVNKGENKVYAYKGNDHSLLWTFPVGDLMYHGSAVADLDNDGKDEIVIGAYNDTLYCLNAENGTLNWKYCQSPSYYMGAPAVIADINNDGNCEVIFSAWYVIGALSNQGNLLWQFDIPAYEQSFRGAAIADINKDKYPDILFGTDQGKIFALNGNDGNQIWTYDLAAHYGNSLFALDNAPLIADFISDDTLEIFIVGGHGEYPDFYKDFGRAYMLSAGKGNGPDWLMFQHDILRQSSLCPTQPSNIINTSPNIFSELHLTPNPATDYIEISYSPLSKGEMRLKAFRGLSNGIKIYNVFGEEIPPRLTASGTPQEGNLKIDVSGLPAGIYFVRVGEKVGKFLKI